MQRGPITEITEHNTSTKQKIDKPWQGDISIDSLDLNKLQISQELNNPILERIQKAVEIVADRKKLSYVIDISTTLYHKGGIDLTPEVMVELLRLDADAVKAAQPK